MTPEALREGIFNLNTRRFGTVAEVMIQRLCNFADSDTIFHDLYDDMQQQRVECKFSTVRKNNKIKVTADTIVEAIEAEMDSNRMINFDDWQSAQFWCNIQQVKRAEFDVLYYGCFFWDRIVIFRITPDLITKENIDYSNKQHKGNVGEGQFGITEKTLQTHLDNYLFAELDYAELAKLLLKKD